MDEWPGGNNLASSPAIWEQMFSEIPSAFFGLNYDPSHLYLQQMDYIRPLYTFRDKIFHVHFKDIKIFRKSGINMEFLHHRFPIFLKNSRAG